MVKTDTTPKTALAHPDELRPKGDRGALQKDVRSILHAVRTKIENHMGINGLRKRKVDNDKVDMLMALRDSEGWKKSVNIKRMVKEVIHNLSDRAQVIEQAREARKKHYENKKNSPVAMPPTNVEKKNNEIKAQPVPSTGNERFQSKGQGIKDAPEAVEKTLSRVKERIQNFFQRKNDK